MGGMSRPISPKPMPLSPARDAYLALVQVHERLSSEFQDLFKSQGLTQTWFNVLRLLVTGPREGLTCQDLGSGLIHRVPDVTRLLDRMEGEGLVSRSRSEEDRRVVLVRATSLGRRRCEALYGDVDELHRAQFAGLSVRSVRELNRLLRDLLPPAP